MCRAQSLFRHSKRLKASLARWTQSRDRLAQINTIFLFCRTPVLGQPRQKNIVRLRRRLPKRLKHGSQGTGIISCQSAFDRLEENNVPHRTAERLISRALESTEFVIFSEDDLIFERDAIEWFARALTHPMFLRPNVWAIAGESRFFDSHRHSPSDTEVSHALAVAESQNLIDKFVYLDLVPSSCFATTREKWAEFGDTRGTIRGDREWWIAVWRKGKSASGQ